MDSKGGSENSPVDCFPAAGESKESRTQSLDWGIDSFFIPRRMQQHPLFFGMGRGTVLDYVKPEAQAVVDDLNELDNEEYEL